MIAPNTHSKYSGSLEIRKSGNLAQVSARSGNNLATKIWKNNIWHNLRSHPLFTEIIQKIIE
jgi:hypothetical protein